MATRASRIPIVLVIFVALVNSNVVAQTRLAASTKSGAIFPTGIPVPPANFTGKAWVFNLIETDSVFNIPIANVTFEPGARTH